MLHTFGGRLNPHWHFVTQLLLPALQNFFLFISTRHWCRIPDSGFRIPGTESLPRIMLIGNTWQLAAEPVDRRTQRTHVCASHSPGFSHFTRHHFTLKAHSWLVLANPLCCFLWGHRFMRPHIKQLLPNGERQLRCVADVVSWWAFVVASPGLLLLWCSAALVSRLDE